MTLRDLFAGLYRWALAERGWILLVCLGVPVLGTAAARVGKAGKTDADGRVIASVVVGFGILTVVLEVVGAICARALLGTSLLDADAVLLVAPVVGLAASLAGIRWVFPLGEVASVRTAIDVGSFVAACVFVLWLASRFRGWGVVFFGSIGQLLVIGALLFALIKRLYRRAWPSTPE